ncbi:hypothetical protein DNTS_015779 [Danionella cerebrum]|uniref:Uncharacterized protein n=1 Tax=Danionella cerebrum TaxID=2873325 RepID=A0A553R0T0_9TELE|nr:hypothetical protein DNTS_015779 [Danionella translucida]
MAKGEADPTRSDDPTLQKVHKSPKTQLSWPRTTSTAVNRYIMNTPGEKKTNREPMFGKRRQQLITIRPESTAVHTESRSRLESTASIENTLLNPFVFLRNKIDSNSFPAETASTPNPARRSKAAQNKPQSEPETRAAELCSPVDVILAVGWQVVVDDERNLLHTLSTLDQIVACAVVQKTTCFRSPDSVRPCRNSGALAGMFSLGAATVAGPGMISSTSCTSTHQQICGDQHTARARPELSHDDISLFLEDSVPKDEQHHLILHPEFTISLAPLQGLTRADTVKSLACIFSVSQSTFLLVFKKMTAWVMDAHRLSHELGGHLKHIRRHGGRQQHHLEKSNNRLLQAQKTSKHKPLDIKKEVRLRFISGTAYLLSELSGWCQDQSLSLFLLNVQLLQDGNGKRGRFPSP